MVTIPDVAAAVAAQLEDQFSATTDITIHVEAGEFYSAEVPAVNIFPTAGTIVETGRLASFADRYGGIPFAIRVRVSPADIYAGQDLLMRLMDDYDPLSIVAALDSDHTLGGTAETIGWGDGWPWTGIRDYPALNGDGFFFGSEMAFIVVKAHS